MQIEETLLTRFSATIEERDGSPVLQIPAHELELGNLSTGESYRIAVLEQPTAQTPTQSTASEPRNARQQRTKKQGPPVNEGDQVEVEIEDIGEQGDGIAKVGPGYVVFVPDADLGDRVIVKIRKALENYAFADVLNGEPIAG